MIQRIQTLYLFLSAGLFFALFFLPLAVIQSGSTLYSFHLAGLYTTTSPVTLAYPAWALFVLAAIIVLLSFLIIFSYKKRILQIRMCIFNILLMIGFCAVFGCYLWLFNQLPAFQGMKISFKIWASFPIISMILYYLAIRNIGADETLVRSLERLR